MIGALLSAAASSAWTYTALVLVACILVRQVPSLMVHIYSSNYQPGDRGRKFRVT
jgi:hypothetical protein